MVRFFPHYVATDSPERGLAPKNVPDSFLVEIAFGGLLETAQIVCLPAFATVELAGKQISDGRCGIDGSARIEKESSGAAGEHILDRTGHFISRCPDDLAPPEGQAWVKQSIEIRVLGARAMS